jgi:putative FmdB family regulatory protein
MPIYDYRCARCGHEVEVSHAIGASGPETCSLCGGPMKKALSAPAIHFKGSGWAKKDARSSTASKAKVGGESTQPGGADDGGAQGSEAGGGRGAESGSSPRPPASSPETSRAKDPSATNGKKPGPSAKGA